MRAMLSRMSAARRLTLREWFDLDEDDSRELVDGALAECEVPSTPHEAVVAWLIVLLSGHYVSRGGFVFGSGVKLAIGRDRGRIADVVCYAPGRKPELGLVSTPPDIVVEVVSNRPRDVRRDRIEKAADYAAFGVKQYWLVDPRVRTFEVWQLTRRRYVRIAAATKGILRVQKLAVDVGALWAHVDRLTR